MLQIQKIRTDKDSIIKNILEVRKIDVTDQINQVYNLDLKKRDTQKHLDEMSANMNALSSQIGEQFKKGAIEKANILKKETKNALYNYAIKICKAVNYNNIGTVEFLVDKHKNFYFMEMNTRIQVEHPVTEEVINFDLIKEQIKIAAGFPISGKNYLPEKWAMECRINAEDVFHDFRPSPGKITVLHKPGGHGVRVDTHIYAGYTIPPNYDSMVAKLITVAQSREEAIQKMQRALDEYIVEGVKTTIPFHQKLMRNEKFRKGDFTTKFLEEWDYNSEQ